MAKKKAGKVEVIESWGGEDLQGKILLTHTGIPKLSDVKMTIWSEYQKNVRLVTMRQADWERIQKQLKAKGNYILDSENTDARIR